MKRFASIVVSLVFIFSILTTTATAEIKEYTSTREGWEIYRSGMALVLEKEQSSAYRPTLFFFGGKGERDSCKRTNSLLKDIPDNGTLKGWNVLSVSILNDDESKNIWTWKSVANGLMDYVTQRVQEGSIDPKGIWLDGYSNGGAGAYFAAVALQGMTVTLPDGSVTTVEIQGLTLIDGTLEGTIKSQQVQEVLDLNIHMTLYVANKTSYSLSLHGKDLVKEYQGTPGFTGILVEHNHGSDIVALTYEVGYDNHRYDGNTTKAGS